MFDCFLRLKKLLAQLTAKTRKPAHAYFIGPFFIGPIN